MPYCEKCGARQVKELTGEFDSKTGKKLTRYICPVDPCGHGYHDDEIFISLNPFAPDFRCKRCGHKSYVD